MTDVDYAEREQMDQAMPDGVEEAESNGELVLFRKPRLPYDPRLKETINVDKNTWRVLTDVVFPTASESSSILLALGYCTARNLDIMKKPVHIVPMRQKRSDGQWRMVDTIWPSIGELRTTAIRTKDYAGKDATEFGPTIDRVFEGEIEVWRDGPNNRRVKTLTPRKFNLSYPEWAQITVYRMVHGVRCAFVGPKVWWTEAYSAIGKTDLPNDMWSERPFGQLEKCAEAAALRCAFPEEIGNDLTSDEMWGKTLIGEAAVAARDVSPTPARISGPPRKVNGNGAEKPSQPDSGNQAEVTKTVAPSGPPRKVPDPKETPKPQEEPKPQPQASGAMPDAKDKQAFLKWVDAKLKECPDADAVMLAWTDEIYESIPGDLHDVANELLQSRLADVGGKP